MGVRKDDILEFIKFVGQDVELGSNSENVRLLFNRVRFDLDASHALSTLNSDVVSLVANAFDSYLQSQSITLELSSGYDFIAYFQDFMDQWCSFSGQVFWPVFGVGTAILLALNCPPPIAHPSLNIRDDYSLFLLSRSYRKTRILASHLGVTVANGKGTLFQPFTGIFFLSPPFVILENQEHICHGFIVNHDAFHTAYFGDLYASSLATMNHTAEALMLVETLACLADFNLAKDLSRYPAAVMAQNALFNSQTRYAGKSLLEQVSCDEEAERKMRARFIERARNIFGNSSAYTNHECDDVLNTWVGLDDQAMHAEFARERAAICHHPSFTSSLERISRNDIHFENLSMLDCIDNDLQSNSLKPFDVNHGQREAGIIAYSLKSVAALHAHLAQNLHGQNSSEQALRELSLLSKMAADLQREIASQTATDLLSSALKVERLVSNALDTVASVHSSLKMARALEPFLTVRHEELRQLVKRE